MRKLRHVWKHYWVRRSWYMTVVNIVISICFSFSAAYERYSMTFDWVMARLGGCFPSKIISQIVLNARLCPLMDDLATEETKYMLWRSSLSINIHEQTAVRLILIVFVFLFLNIHHVLY